MIATDTTIARDAWLFGWDPTPGIVSAWADDSGRALVWQRDGEAVRRIEARFRPWLFAASLDDVRHLGDALVEDASGWGENAPFSFRKLDGSRDSLRYLLSARDGRALRRAIVQGAQQRLGPSIGHPRDLPGEYYTVGAVEQYLMQTGRVCFRGMAYADLHRLQFDLETTSLSPKRGRIFMVAVRDSRGMEAVLEAPTEGDEAALIAGLCTLIRKHDPDVIENHNLFGFDLPFLVERARTLGVPLNLARHPDYPLLESYDEPNGWGDKRRVRYRIAGRELIDTLDAVRRHDFSARDMTGHGLKAAARYFGVEATDRTHVAGAETFSTYQADPERVRRYALDDVIEVDGLSRRLMGAAFALAGMAPRRYERVASAGPAMGLLEPLLVRAYLRAGAALPRNAAEADDLLAPHQGGATILYAAGIARRVVKADIASMYPSIMRTFRIGPACDPQGALLALVDRLTDLRLEHRRQAATLPTGSAEAHRHHALQAAMKIVINSAYGYMGAGKMALFADRRAADEVTRRGREILGNVVDGLRERGLALIEADTDGVYFGVPEGWGEEEERACVAAIAATLPPGIGLGYDGRYRAMLSHEVKNYALLTYDGRLIVRGNAFQSSRTEPFGARFLRAALRCALEGDSAGVRQAYLDAVAALRGRTLSPEDVATLARITKTPEEYEQSRAKSREAAYEALLVAGRTRWRSGERVRFYRAADGAAIWLPDKSGNDTEDSPEQGAATTNNENRPPYDIAHYLAVLQTSFVSRFRKAFSPEDFEQLFRPSGQLGLFDRALEEMQPLWIEAQPHLRRGDPAGRPRRVAHGCTIATHRRATRRVAPTNELLPTACGVGEASWSATKRTISAIDSTTASAKQCAAGRRGGAWEREGAGAMPRWRVGVDAGGTFTDVCLFEEETGAIRVTKVSSTPADPSQAIAAGVAAILAQAGEGEVAYFAHGTTVATNTLIQGRGAATGLITTAGFRDILEIGRQRRPDLYDLQADKPEPLVRRDRRLEVGERVLHDGTVERALDEAEVRAAVRHLRAMGVRAVAVCFLYSYLYPQHEQIVARILREEFPETYASISHEVLPEFREYERLSTTVINAYLGPVMASYLANLRPQLAALGIAVPPHITQSNGGIISFEAAEHHPVRTVLSGPSSGVVGALAVARLAGLDDLITFDMGGTSTDVSLVARGQPKLTGEMEVEGYPVKTPMIDIHAVGAGGGSIAWIDSGGHLKVGPQSAGADPGPVCYGLGNDEPTVTDANVVLGTLPQSHLLGGRMPIDAAAARGAIERLATRLGLDTLATAQGIISVVTATMARTIRVISVQRGYDPRDHTLVAFGGAGPLHAARLARELDIPRVLVPEAPGILCALGLLVTDLRTDFSLTRLLPLTPDSLDAINAAFAELAARTEAWFAQEGIPPDRQLLRHSVDLRYQGQNYELPVAAPGGALTEASLAELATGFAQAHEQLYGYDQPGEPIQAVTFRIEASGITPKAELRPSPLGTTDANAARTDTRNVYLPEAGEGFVACPVYERALLTSGNHLTGPALIDQLDATTLILPGQRATVDAYRNVLIEVG